MSYQVIRSFRDKEDKLRNYRKGDTFPAKGEVSQERLKELMGKDNDVKSPLIKRVGPDDPVEKSEELGEGSDQEEGEFPKHTGGAWYELSNGEKIQGKDEAIAAEAELK